MFYVLRVVHNVLRTGSLAGSVIAFYSTYKGRGVELYLNLSYMGIILWIVFGALVGWVASLIMRTDATQGTILNIIIGIIGAVIGGWVMSAIGKYGVTGFNLYSFLVALLGAIILIAVVKLIGGL